MSWAWWVLLIGNAIGSVFGYYRLLAGRKAIAPPATVGEAVGRVVVWTVYLGIWLWLFLTATGVLS